MFRQIFSKSVPALLVGGGAVAGATLATGLVRRLSVDYTTLERVIGMLLL